MEKFIDVEKIINSKRPALLRWLPTFVINYLKRIIHQDEINRFIEKHHDKKNEAFCQEVIRYFNIEIEVENIERIPKEGKVTLAMNHPLGGMDAMVLVTALREHRSDLRFIVNDILMNLDNLKDLFVGVNKIGKYNSSMREKITHLFESDHAVCVFPAGLVSRKTKGIVKDTDWKKTFVSYSKKFDRTVIPIYIDGKLSNFFYRLANFRRFLGMKLNIEMLYLSDELFKQHNKRIRVIIGEPVQVHELHLSSDDNAMAQKIKQKVYDLQS